MFTFLKKLLNTVTRVRINIVIADPKTEDSDSANTIQMPAAQRQPRAACPVAHFEIIGLDKVKQHYATHWPIIHDRVHQVVCMIIRKHLKSDESYNAMPPEGYIVTFMRSGTDAMLAAEAIRKSIEDIFLRDARIAQHMGIRMRMSANAQMDDDSMTSPADPAFQGRVKEKKAVYIRASVPDDALVFKSGSDEKNGRLRPLLMRDDDGAAILHPALEIAYMPIIRQLDGKVGFHLCFPRLKMEDGSVLEGYDVLPEEADDDMILALDLKILNHIHAALLSVNADCHTPTRVVCPIHYRTIMDPRKCKSYGAAYAKMRAKNMDKCISFQVINMPRALYGPELKTPINFLKSLCPRILVMSPWDRPADGALVEAGVNAVAIDFSGCGDKPDHILTQKMRNFTRQANKEKLLTLALGLSSAQLLNAARQAGFTHICGTALQENPYETTLEKPTCAVCDGVQRESAHKPLEYAR